MVLVEETGTLEQVLPMTARNKLLTAPPYAVEQTLKAAGCEPAHGAAAAQPDH